MMPKKTGLHDLPLSITDHAIGEYLTEKDKLELARTSKKTQGLFQPHRLQIMADKLLLQVMHGKQDKAEEILKLNPELLEMTGEATDYSGRTFNTTAFRYALWALDTRYMCNMMLDCLPCSPKGEAIKQALLMQFKAHQQDGVQYTLNGVTIHETHYDFSPLIEALQTYANHYDNLYGNNYSDTMMNLWSKVVGLAQRYVPAHVAQHYCDPDESFFYPTAHYWDPNESFYPTPAFNKKTFKRSLEFFNYATNASDFWFATVSPTSTSGLGIDFGILRGMDRKRANWACRGRIAWQGSLVDLKALTALCEVRTNDLVPLMQRLEGPIQKPDADPDMRQFVIS